MLTIGTLARTELGLSQSDLAKAVGVTQACISSWEAGIRRPREAHLWKVIHKLATYAYAQGRSNLVEMLLGEHAEYLGNAWFPLVPPPIAEDETGESAIEAEI